MNTARIVLSAIVLLLLTATGSVLRAQQNMEIEEITVIAPYVPTISDAYKINDSPRLDDTLTVNLDFAYQISPRPIQTRFSPEPISAARMRGEPLPKLYRGLVKGGFGSYYSPYLEAFYNTLRSNEYSLGLHLKHFSSSGKIQDHDFSSFSDNSLNLYGKRFFNNLTLQGGIGYERDVVHYYGFRREDFQGNENILQYIDSLDKQDLRQHYNHFLANIGLGSSYSDSTRTNFRTALGYGFLADRHDGSEHNLKFSANVGRQLPDDPTGFGIKHYFGLDAVVDFYNTTTPIDTAAAALISLKPQLFSRSQNFRFNIGLDASVQTDTISTLRVYPVVAAEVNIIPEVLIGFAHGGGRLEKHSMRSFSRYNPFINTAMHYGFLNVKNEIGGGMKGSLSDYVSYSFSAINSRIDNFAFFITDSASILNNQFTVAYDDIRRFSMRGELFGQLRESFSTRIRVDLHQYSVDQQLEAWYMPTTEISLNLRYNIQNKIILSADAFARDSVYGLIYDLQWEPKSRQIHGFHVDFNFGIEYRYTNILSVFLNFNNLQNQSREKWLNYPSQRLNVLGGISYKF
jgi:hypothetical protein